MTTAARRPGAGWRAGPGRACSARLLPRPGQDRRAVRRGGRKRYTVPGDLARVEADGTITLLGRGNTCVNTGGEKVFPEEVESALKSHAAVFDALAIGVPDDVLGQRVAALVQAREGREVDLAALEAHLRRQIAGTKGRAAWLVDAVRLAPAASPTTRGRAAMRPPAGERGTPGGPRGMGGRRPSGGLRRRQEAGPRRRRKEALCGPRCARCSTSSTRLPGSPRPSTWRPRSAAGGLGVLGCVRFNDPDELDAVLDWMDANTAAGRTASTS